MEETLNISWLKQGFLSIIPKEYVVLIFYIYINKTFYDLKFIRYEDKWKIFIKCSISRSFTYLQKIWMVFLLSHKGHKHIN